MKRYLTLVIALLALNFTVYSQTKTVTVDANDVLNNNTKIVAQTAAGQIFFQGHQLGSSYGYPSGIFRASTDNPTGASNYFYDGVANGVTNFSIRADGQGYFAGNVGIGTTIPTSVEASSKFTVSGTSSGTAIYNTVIDEGGNQAGTMYYNRSNGSTTAKGGISQVGNSYLGLFTATTGSFNGANLAIQNSTGNVGIGTTVPKSTLHLMGTFIAGGNNANIDPAITANIPNNLANTGQMLIGWNRAAGAGETDFIGNQGGGGTGGFAFYNHDNSNTETQLMWIQGNGNVAIGTSNPNGYKLAVKGNIHAQQVNVDLNGWSDYVFNKDYHLPTLSEVKTYIDQNHHLPEMPSEQEVIKDGLNLGEMNKLLAKKVEELTLYLLEQQKQIDDLKKQYKEITKK